MVVHLHGEKPHGGSAKLSKSGTWKAQQECYLDYT
jgi:hypothetical protein